MPEPNFSEFSDAELDRRTEERQGREREARIAAGLGFWRLVWVVALGILIADGLGALAAILWRAIS